MSGNCNGKRTLAYLRGETNVFAEREKLAQARRKIKPSGLSYWLCCPNKRRRELFWNMASLLGTNSRMTLTEMSRRLNVPVTTLYDMLRQLEKVFTFTIALKAHEKQALEQIARLQDSNMAEDASAAAET